MLPNPFHAQRALIFRFDIERPIAAQKDHQILQHALDLLDHGHIEIANELAKIYVALGRDQGQTHRTQTICKVIL